jgi:hypothetical protein
MKLNMWIRLVLVAAFFVFGFQVKAQTPVENKSQDVDAHSPKPAPGSKQQNKADKKKAAQKKKIEKGDAKARKHQMKIQTRNTKKMMRKSKKKAKKFNDN